MNRLKSPKPQKYKFIAWGRLSFFSGLGTKEGFKWGGEPCDPRCVLLGRQCGLTTKEGFKRGGEPCDPRCVLLGRQCGLSTKEGFEGLVSRVTLDVFCSAGNVVSAGRKGSKGTVSRVTLVVFCSAGSLV